MQKTYVIVLVGALGGAAVLGLYGDKWFGNGAGATAERIAPAKDTPREPMGASQAGEPLPPGHPPVDSPLPPAHPLANPATGALPPDHPPTGALPPGHPPMGSSMGAAANEPAEASGLSWTAPPRWKDAPNPSSMRIATFKIPRAAGDNEDAELSIMRAGGTTDANIARWIGQFDAPSQPSAKRREKTVRGTRVALVEIHGTFAGGMMGGSEGKPGWALIGAVAETGDSAHFFKLTGPEKTVTAARTEFDALVDSLTPKK